MFQDLRELFSLPEEGFDTSVTQQQMHEEHDQQLTMYDLNDKFHWTQMIGIHTSVHI